MSISNKNRRKIPLIVFCSRTDNTRRIARTMAKALAAETVSIEKLKEHQLRGRPLIGLGSGVYWLRLERRIIELAARIPSGCRVFIFSTSGWGQAWVGFYQSELLKKLKQEGIEVIGQWHGPGQDRNPLFKWLNISKGRPSEEDIRAAREFAAALKPGRND